MRMAVWLLVVCWAAPAASAQDRFAVVVSGASGGEVYAAQHQKWRTDLVSALESTLQFPRSSIIVLSEEDEQSSRATAANVQRALGDLRRRAGPDDLVILVLIGHGTFDGADAKFNLVGPDLTADAWAEALAALPARTVVVNTTASSFPFLEQLSGRGRVVITATDSAAQRFATVFPEYFVKAMAEPASDGDKNGRISVWEAFTAASAAVRRHYEERGQLSTERPLLDDDGDRVGRDAQAPGADGALARALFLDPGPTRPDRDATTLALEQQRLHIESRIEELKSRKAATPEDLYRAELEHLLVQLARLAQQIRARS